MLGAEARQGAFRHPISVSCIGDGIRTLERQGVLWLLNRRCDLRSPSGILRWQSDPASARAELVYQAKPSIFWMGPMPGQPCREPWWDPDSIGPALRAGSSSTTTGRQAALLDAHPSPRCGRRGFRSCRTRSRGIASRVLCLHGSALQGPVNRSAIKAWMGSPFGNFFPNNQHDMTPPTSPSHGRKKHLSRPPLLSIGHGCPCGRRRADIPSPDRALT